MFEKNGGFPMGAENSYGIGFFITGNYHILCHEGKEYRFHIINPDCDFEPVQLDYYEARKFIETHPVCTNITNHEIRIMQYGEIRNILLGKSPVSSVMSLAIVSEEEDEEPLH
jgi:hypothetical protein